MVKNGSSYLFEDDHNLNNTAFHGVNWPSD